MSDKPTFAADYVQVHERVAAFYAKFPDGSLQSRIIELTDSRIVMEASAYRTADDTRPGIGYSSLEIPGRTPYTRGSEIENCETSAWGRAIAALGFEVKRGIATADEIANKSGQEERVTVMRPAARPVVVRQARHEFDGAPVAVPDEPPGLMDDIDDESIPSDICAEHHISWIGDYGDRYHKKPEGGYCRTAPGNVAKARA